MSSKYSFPELDRGALQRVVAIIGCLLVVPPAAAQSSQISGRVLEYGFDKGMRGANIVASSLEDSTKTTGTSTSRNGLFELEVDWRGQTAFRISHVGFRIFEDTLDVKGDLDFGVVSLRPEVLEMEAVEIAARRERMTIRGDTVEFFAGGFFVPRYTYAESLVEALPGFEVRGGLVFYLGRPVDRVLIDGRAYFGKDVMEALQTMPIEMIESLQLYDQLPEGRRFSGIDDGSREQVINLVTDPNRRNAMLVNATAGGGSADRYALSSGLNHLNGPKQIRASLSSNNTSQSSRGGISRTNTGNLAYADTWNENTRLRLNYVAKDSRRDQLSELSRSYFDDTDAAATYDETRESGYDTRSHTLTGSLRHTVDDRHQFSFAPRLLVMSSDVGSSFQGASVDPITGTPRSIATTNDYASTSLTGGFSSDWEFNRERGPSFMASLGASFSNDDSDDQQASSFAQVQDTGSTTNTITTSDDQDRSLNAALGLMDRIGENGYLSIGLDHGWTSRIVDRRSELDDDPFEIPRLDSTLSNDYDGGTLSSGLTSHIGYYRDKRGLDLNLSIRRETRKWEQTFPETAALNETDYLFSGALNVQHGVGARGNLRASYDISGQPPPSDGLQREVDNSNPLLLSVGNPDLRSSVKHKMEARINMNNPKVSFASSIRLDLTQNVVGTETFFAGNEARSIFGIEVPAGGQLTRPASLGDQRSVSWTGNATRPFRAWKGGSVSLNLSARLEARPFSVNGSTEESTTSRISSGVTIGAQPLAQTRLRASYSIARSSQSTLTNSALSNDYLSHSGQISANTTSTRGYTAQTSFSFRVFNRFESDFDSNTTNWNMSFSYRPPSTPQLSTTLAINDILNAGANVQRTSSDIYLESTRNNRLSRHLVFSLRWEIRTFGPGTGAG